MRALGAVVLEDGQTFRSLHDDGSLLSWSVSDRSLRSVEHASNKLFRTGVLLSTTQLLVLEPLQFCLWNYCEKTLVWSASKPMEKTPKFCKSGNGAVLVAEDAVVFLTTGEVCWRSVPGPQQSLTHEGHFVCSWSRRENLLQISRTRDGVLAQEQTFAHHVQQAVCSRDGQNLFVLTEGALHCLAIAQDERSFRVVEERWIRTEKVQGISLYLCEGREEVWVYEQERFRYRVHSMVDGTLLRYVGAQREILAASRDGSVAVCGDGMPFLIGNLQTGLIDDVLPSEAGPVHEMQVSASGRFLLWWNDECTTIADAATGEALATLSTWTGSSLFLPEETRLFSRSGIFDWKHMEWCLDLREHSLPLAEAVHTLRCTRDGSLVLMVGRGVVLLSVSDGTVLWEDDVEYRSADFSEDEQTVWVAGEACTEQRAIADGSVLGAVATRDSWVVGQDRSCVIRSWGTARILETSTDVVTECLFQCVQDFETERWMGRFVSGVLPHLAAVANRSWCFVWDEEIPRSALFWQGRVVGAVAISPQDKLQCAVISMEKNCLFLATARGNIFRYELPVVPVTDEAGE